jgi:16S rRNA (guanine(966)-N(2))-methyltransferase RsmD
VPDRAGRSTRSAGRVIAGAARGISLRAPRGTTRPLGDRVKQALFAILEPELPGARFFDLFAGSGAAGIEALSRGAEACWFVEADDDAVAAIAQNLARAGLEGRGATVVRSDVLAWLAASAPAIGPAHVVVLDPPYDRPDLLLAALGRLGAAGSPRLLAERAVVVAKHFWRGGPPARIGLLASERERRFGETALTFYRRQPEVGERA